MTIRMTGAEARLEGDWTLTAVTRNIDSLAFTLQQLGSHSDKNLRIDCGQMKEADISGLQLLNVWMQCAKIRGMKPTLVNVPERLRHAMHVVIDRCMIDTYPAAAMMAG